MVVTHTIDDRTILEIVFATFQAMVAEGALVRGSTLGVVLFGCVSAIALGKADPAFAQAILSTPPPIRSAADSNGVDVVSGDLVLSSNDLSIGQAGGLTYTRTFVGVGWRDNLMSAISSSGSIYTVSFGGGSESFSLSGGVFTQSEGAGSTLTFDTAHQTYTYTSGNGVVVKFDKAYAEASPLSANEGQIVSVTMPDGEIDTYAYKTVNLCATGGGSCANYFRLQSVSNNLGYQLKLSYLNNSPINNLDSTGWQKLIGVTAINNAVDYCDPSSDSCSGFTVAWPTVGYSASAGPPLTSSSTDALGNVTRYTYDSGGHITGIKRPSAASDTATLSYDASGRVYQLSNGVGTWTYTYQDVGSSRTTTVTDPLSHSRIVVSDLSTGLISTDTNGVGKVTSYQYDANGRITRVTLPEGNYTQYVYDTRGNISSATRVAKPSSGMASILTSATYPPSCVNPVTCNLPTASFDAYGKETDYTYDAVHGGILTMTSPAAGAGLIRPKVTYHYSLETAWYKNSTGVIVPGGTVYRLDSTSQCQTTASCAGGTDEVKTTIDYGTGSSSAPSNVLPLSLSKAAGDGSLAATSTVTYDAIGNTQTVDGPLAGTSDTTHYHYDANRRLIGVVLPDPDGAGALIAPAVRLTYNADGQRTLVERGTIASDASWPSISVLEQMSYGYDGQGNLTSNAAVASGVTVKLAQYSYDADGRPDCTAIRMNPSTFASEPAACTLGAVGTNGPDRISRNFYDAADRVVKVTAGYGTSSQADYATYAYTPNGLRLSVQDAMANLTTFEYDGFDRQSKTRFPVSAQSTAASSSTDFEAYSYDTMGGRLTGVTRRGGDTISFSYDDLGRTIEKDVPGGTASDVYYGYDLLGRPTYAHYGAAAGSGVDYQYDALSRMTGESTTGKTMTYQYDLAGERTRITWPDGVYVVYDYDLAGRVTSIRENGASSGAGVLASYAYDDHGRRTAIARAGGAGAATSYASYDGANNLTGLSHTFAGSSSYNLSLGYSYNAAGQVISRTSTNEGYAYHPPAVSKSYVTNGLNQYTSVSGSSYSYDARGNLTSDGSRTFTYDVENRLLTASAPTAVSLAYDPIGRMQTSTTSSGATTYLYSGASLVAEYSSAGMVRRYVPGPSADEPVVWYEGAGTSDRRWLVQDNLGSTVAYADGAGVVSGTYGYGVYGEPSSWAGPASAPRYRYTGQISIPEAQLYYYKSRVYDPSLRRFLQVDPSGYRSDYALYNYMQGDPLNGTDTSGLGDPNAIDEITVTGRRCTANASCYYDVKLVLGSGSAVVLRGVPFSFSGGGGGGSSDADDDEKNKKCPKNYTVYMLGGTASAAIIGGGNIGVVVGFTIPENTGEGYTGTQFFISGQGGLMGGGGAFVGAGAQGAIGRSTTGTLPLFSGSRGLFVEGDIGWNFALGFDWSVDVDHPDNQSTSVGLPIPKVGAGWGAFLGLGGYLNGTVALTKPWGCNPDLK